MLFPNTEHSRASIQKSRVEKIVSTAKLSKFYHRPLVEFETLIFNSVITAVPWQRHKALTSEVMEFMELVTLPPLIVMTRLKHNNTTIGRAKTDYIV